MELDLYLSSYDSDRLFAVKNLTGNNDLTANEFAEKLLPSLLHHVFPKGPRYSEHGELLNPEEFQEDEFYRCLYVNCGLSEDMTERLNALAADADKAFPKEYHTARHLYFDCKITPDKWPNPQGSTSEERGEGMTPDEIKSVQFYLRHLPD